MQSYWSHVKESMNGLFNQVNELQKLFRQPQLSRPQKKEARMGFSIY
jgi:hypothetical protein